jgi:hypothetical protein
MESLIVFAAFVIGFGLWRILSPRRRDDDGADGGGGGNGWDGDGGDGGNGGGNGGD